MSGVYIYLLSDPDSNISFYAGKTTDPKRRFYKYKYGGHAKLVEWISNLKDVGKLPVMSIVDECDAEHADEIEDQWITVASCACHHEGLLNTRRGCGLITRTPAVKAIHEQEISLGHPALCGSCNKPIDPNNAKCFIWFPEIEWTCNKCK